MKILYLAPVYYDDMKQRPQQLAECLSNTHEVYYIEPTISLIRWMLKKGKSYKGKREKISRSLTVIRLNGLFTLHKSIEILDVLGFNNWSEYLQIKKLAKSCDVIWAGYAGWYTLVRYLREKPVVYDKMDEEDLLAAPGLLRMTLRRNKRKMVQTADLIFTSSLLFYRRHRKKERVCLVQNAISEDFITRQSEYPQIEKRRDTVVFGYIGTIGRWFDFAVVSYILRLNRQYKVVLVGRNLMPVFQHARVTYLGVMPYEKLPEIVSSFDVCLYNFKKNALLDTVNPVKLYEYLAAGKPVLAIDSLETRAFGRYVMKYGSVDEIGDLLKEGIRQPFGSEEEYMEFIGQNTWQHRANIAEYALNSLMRGFVSRKEE